MLGDHLLGSDERLGRRWGEREAFGGPIIDTQGIAFPLAELAVEINAACC